MKHPTRVMLDRNTPKANSYKALRRLVYEKHTEQKFIILGTYVKKYHYLSSRLFYPGVFPVKVKALFFFTLRM